MVRATIREKFNFMLRSPVQSQVQGLDGIKLFKDKGPVSFCLGVNVRVSKWP